MRNHTSDLRLTFPSIEAIVDIVHRTARSDHQNAGSAVDLRFFFAVGVVAIVWGGDDVCPVSTLFEQCGTVVYSLERRGNVGVLAEILASFCRL